MGVRRFAIATTPRDPARASTFVSAVRARSAARFETAWRMSRRVPPPSATEREERCIALLLCQVALNLALCFGAMPLLAVAIARALGLAPATSAGLVLLGSVSGGQVHSAGGGGGGGVPVEYAPPH